MDEVNENKNAPSEMTVKNLLPDAALKTAYETYGTDIPWFTDIYIEYAAGTWAQASDADKRIGQESASLFNNSWNSLYDVMNICKVIIDKTDPVTGTEPINYGTRGVAEVLMAINLAVVTDMWGEAPYTEAFQGSDNLQPKYDKQSDLYVEVFRLLDDAIVNLGMGTAIDGFDYIYGGSRTNWIRAAHSLKARYLMRLTKVRATAATEALAEIALGFQSSADQMIFNHYVDNFPNGNPWFEYWYLRDHNSISSTIVGLLLDRNDPREYWYHWGGDIAPIGEAEQTQGGYSQSYLTTGYKSWNIPTPVMTYHELLFIKTEAEFRTGAAPAVWQATLEDAITAQFSWLSEYMLVDDTDGDPDPDNIGDAADYFATEVLPLLTVGNELNEIMTQKYLGLFEMEAMETYNDYRRTGFPTMMNPNNATVGFPNRFPFAVSETSSNPDNVPTVSIYTDKVWWAGGTEN
ncbi:MAG: hypothetical protein A2X00_07385 [Bacteroidetes bacterium GWE2_32_14]|nr:MAG: hypothetical protein A2X00_07385 [Bacteroidetes bacterium GWE2_32_14]